MIRHGPSRNQIAPRTRRSPHRRATDSTAAASRSSRMVRVIAAHRITTVASQLGRSLHAPQAALLTRNPATPKPLYP
jgi:hypothetical protein